MSANKRKNSRGRRTSDNDDYAGLTRRVNFIMVMLALFISLLIYPFLSMSRVAVNESTVAAHEKRIDKLADKIDKATEKIIEAITGRLSVAREAPPPVIDMG